MALQGTLDTFALADLVRLLATTSKTGELAIDGDRGSGRLWFADGQLVGGEPAADDLADVVFTLLRTEEGEFAFHADVEPADDVRREARSALDVLAAAEARLEEWRPVAELVPSPRVAVTLRAELAGDEVTIGRDLWRSLVAVAAGTTAADLGAALDLDETAAAFVVRDLVEAGLVEVGDEVAEPEPEPEVAAEAVAAEPEAVSAEPAVAAVEEPEPAVEVVTVAVEEPAPVVVVAPVVEIAPAPVAEEVAEVEDEPAEPAAPVLGVVPEPPYSFGSWDDGVVPAPEHQADPASLGPWEPLTAADAEPPAEADALPSLDAAGWADPMPAEPVADALPSLDAAGWADPVPAEPVADALPSLDAAGWADPVPAEADALPSLDAAGWAGPELAAVPEPPAPVAPVDDLGSYAVDLDSPLGTASGHSYLGTAEVGSALPEPLLGAEGVPTSDAAALSAPPEPPAPTSYPEPGTGAADELAARRDHAEATTWGTPAPASTPDDLGVPLDSLSPAAARALAAAASADANGDDDTDAGRRVLRRIISTGKG